jgi:ABC-type spermidine/putrescine transport system permease subunit I
VAPVVAHAGSDLSVLPETRRSLLRLLVSGRGWVTLALPELTTLGCLALGYPNAYLMHLSGRRVPAIAGLLGCNEKRYA